MFRWFEKLLYPFPEATLSVPPKSFWAFVWAGTQGLRIHLALMTLLTAAIGAFEALLFAFMGKIVDWLSEVPPHMLWEQEGSKLLLLATILMLSLF